MAKQAASHGYRNGRTAYLGLGSSLGQRAANLREALALLEADREGINIRAVSPIYGSPHLGLKPGDETHYPPHLNCVAEIETCLDPESLLQHIQTVENAGGRTRTEKWGPRTIDIDILLYDNRECQSETLTLPHPGLANRAFVVVPLFDLVPDLCLPNGKNLDELRYAPAIEAQPLVRYADTLDAACGKEMARDNA